MISWTIETDNHFGLVADELPRYASRLIRDAAFDIYRFSQENCPVRTGRLKASGYVEERGAFDYAVVYTAPYAKYVHDGTGRRLPNPFLDDAYQVVYPIFLAEVEDVARTLENL